MADNISPIARTGRRRGISDAKNRAAIDNYRSGLIGRDHAGRKNDARGDKRKCNSNRKTDHGHYYQPQNSLWMMAAIRRRGVGFHSVGFCSAGLLFG
ncbi:MAG: hypothetical protein DCF15_03575 [Phormidesmis priestleyi]|uniref:Uncharacterized protein n=1 Tax=Phormidesmis priestleyi TaxID=268141 RepID=A0A2W4XUV7_9CYAN|nr:MAG: hypothetical protein DCF15_03575 [Phormidesmis priestleyi]